MPQMALTTPPNIHYRQKCIDYGKIKGHGRQERGYEEDKIIRKNSTFEIKNK
jgi:hypothetical protein